MKTPPLRRRFLCHSFSADRNWLVLRHHHWRRRNVLHRKARYSERHHHRRLRKSAASTTLMAGCMTLTLPMNTSARAPSKSGSIGRRNDCSPSRNGRTDHHTISPIQISPIHTIRANCRQSYGCWIRRESAGSIRSSSMRSAPARSDAGHSCKIARLADGQSCAVHRWGVPCCGRHRFRWDEGLNAPLRDCWERSVRALSEGSQNAARRFVHCARPRSGAVCCCALRSGAWFATGCFQSCVVPGIRGLVRWAYSPCEPHSGCVLRWLRRGAVRGGHCCYCCRGLRIVHLAGGLPCGR